MAEPRRCALFILLGLATLTRPAVAQVVFSQGSDQQASLCDTVVMTTRFQNAGATVSGLIITQYLPSALYKYVPSNSTVTLPDGSVLSNAAADPIISGTNLVWSLASVVGTGGISHLLITEVMYDPTNAANTDYEWVELFNPTTNSVGITNWSIRDTQPGQVDALPTMTIGAREFVIVAANSNLWKVQYPSFTGKVFEVADHTIGSGLNGFADGVVLLNSSSVAVDAMSYGASAGGFSPPAPLILPGHTLERNPANLDTDSNAEWTDQPVPNPGSGTVYSGIQGGEQVKIVFKIEVPCGSVAGQFTARAVYQQPPGTPHTDIASMFLTVNQGDLTVRKLPLVQSAVYSNLVTWTLQIRNEGFGNARNVTIMDRPGPGISLVSFSVNPTNAPPYGTNSVEWNQGVIAALTNLPPGGEVDIVVTGRVMSCDFLYNDADARWGCTNLIAATNGVCEDTRFNGQTARATIDFLQVPPLLSMTITNASPLPVAYCGGSDITLKLTNSAASPGHAFNIDFSTILPSGFALTGASVATNRHVIVGTLPAGSSTSIIVHITATNCAAPAGVQTLAFAPTYQSVCGIQFSAASLAATFQLGAAPAASVSKDLPTVLYGDQTNTTVTILYNYQQFTNGTPARIVDVFPRDTNGLLRITNVTVGGVKNGTNITWATNLSGSGVFTARFDLVQSSGTNGCGVPSGFFQNTLFASNFVDCLGCTRLVSGSGLTYPITFQPAPGCPLNGTNSTGNCTFVSARLGPSLTEVCTPATLSMVASNITGVDLPTNWNNVVFTSDLGGGQGFLASTSSVTVTADGSNVTRYVTITATNPLTVDLAGLTNSFFSRPGLVTNALRISWDVASTNTGTMTDTTALTLPPCGQSVASFVWNVGRTELGITLQPFTNTEGCSVSRVRIDVTNLPSPNLAIGSNGIFAAYDVQVLFNLDADSNGVFTFSYLTNSTAFTNMTALGGGSVPPSEPVQTSNLLAWTVGDLASNGAGSILFTLRSPCSISTNERMTAYVRFNEKCRSGLPQNRQSNAGTNDISLLFSPIMNDAISPQFSFLTSTQYVLNIYHLNSGAGGAYNVRTEMLLPTNIAFGSASITPDFISATSVVWAMQSTNVVGGLTDRDGDGFVDDLPPNGQFTIYVTNYIKSCSSNEVEARTSHGCGTNICQVTSNKVGVFYTGAGSVITRAVFPVDGDLCGTNPVDYSIRNSGLIDAYNVRALQILPDNVTYVTNSSRYVYLGVTNAIAGDPLGDGTSGNPLVWDKSLVPPFTTFNPTQTVEILYDVAISCQAISGNRQLTAQASFVDNCGVTQLNQQVFSTLTINQPTLTVIKSGSLDGTNYASGLLVADPTVNTQVYFRIVIDHSALSAANVAAMQMTDVLPTNVVFASAWPPPDTVVGSTGATLFWSMTNLMAQVTGAPPYKPSDPAITLVVTGRVTTCFPDVFNQVSLQYGCDTSSLCLSTPATLRFRTQPVASLQLSSSLSISPCGGTKTVPVTNNGATAQGIILKDAAPPGFVFTGARVSGGFVSSNLIVSLGGSPVGSLATIDFTATNTCGATDISDDAHDGPALMDIGYLGGFVVTYDLVSVGTNLDCVANPTDLDYADPEPPGPAPVSCTSTLQVSTICGAVTTYVASVTTIPPVPDPDIDVQPNSAVVSNGQVQTFTVNVKNGAELGNADNLHIRVRFGTAWTNLTLVSSQIVERTTGSNMVVEIQGSTNVLIDLPGVVLDPIADHVTLVFNATAVEKPGTLSVLAEVVGDCVNTGVIPSCVFSNTLGQAPLADSMTGSVVGAVHGQYYAFDQDQTIVAGFQLSKTVRYDEEAPGAAGKSRNGRIGEQIVYRLDAHYFGNVFSNVLVTETLPTNMLFSAPESYAFSGSITGAAYDATSGVFTLSPTVLAVPPSVFTVDLPALVSNKLVNQNGIIITNVADSTFFVTGFTNDPPASTGYVPVVEPDLVITKTVNSNLVQAGDFIVFTNRIRHVAISSTTAYDLVYSDALPAGLTFSGINLGSDGIDNDGDGLTDEVDEATLVSGNTITITTNNNANLASVATNQSVTIIFPALVTNELIGSTIVNTARVTYTSLDGIGTNFNERDGSGGTNTLNDYVRTNTVALPVKPIASVSKTFVSSSQTNTLDGATNSFTIGERMIYNIHVDIPQGIANNVTITDRVPPGLDWVGVNTNAGLSFPGAGYQFIVPSGGPQFAQTTNAGLVIVDPDLTPDDSLTLDGSGSNIVFRIGAITNTPDGNLTNDFFNLQMEFVVLNDPVNTGLLGSVTSASNRVLVADAFTTRGATGPVYSIAEHNIRVFKFMSATNLDAGDTVIVTMRVQNSVSALSHAYDMQATDFFPTDLFVSASFSNLVTPAGWAVSNTITSFGYQHYLYSTGTTALAPALADAVTNVFSIQLAQSVTPNRLYTNTANVFTSDTIYGTPPGGIPERVDSNANFVVYQVPNVAIAKSLFSTSETNIPPDSQTTNVQIGEVVTYRIDVTLPESTITNLQVTDFFPSNGVAYIRGSARVDTNSFNGTLGALNETPTGAGLITSNGQIMTFTFTNVSVVVGDNNVPNNTFQLYLDTIVNTNVINTGTVAATATVHTNWARISFGGVTAGAVTSGVVRTKVVEPRLVLTKNIVQTNADAGDLVDMSLTITNAGTAAAYDLTITDPLLPPFFDPDTVTNVVMPTGYVFSVVSSNLVIQSDTNAPTGTNTVEVGEFLTFTFQARMSPSLAPNMTATNVATLAYDSLRGTNIYALQRFYATTSSDTIAANNFTLQKTLFGTSENGPSDSSGTNVQVGEVVTYQIQTSLPEGAISNLTFTDVLPTNMSFIVGSVVVDASSLNGTLAPVTNVTPNTGSLGSNGQNVVIAFLGMTTNNADNNVATDILRIRLNAVVLDTNGVVGTGASQTVETNLATVTYTGNPRGPSTSGVVRTTVIEPTLAISKNIDIPSGDAGDTATVTLVLTNSGLATAYDVILTDTVFGAQFDVASITNLATPAGFTFAVLTNGANDVVVYQTDATSGEPTNTLEAGEGLTFQFRVQLAQGVAPAQVLVNTAYVSRADTIYGSPSNGNDRQKGGQFSGDSVIVSNLLIAKVLSVTSETGPSDTLGTNVAIGEVATYAITVTMPESTITNLTVVDDIPVGMSYISNTLDTTGFGGTLPGAPTVTTTSTNGADVTFTFNGLTVVSNNNNGTDNSFIIRLSLLTLNVAGNDGRPVVVDGTGQTIISNRAFVSFYTNATAYTTQVVNVQVVEPALAIVKTMTGPTNGYVSITWTVTNRGPETAFDVVMTDLFPTNWWDTTSITGVMPAGFVYTATGAPNNAIVNVASDTSSGPPTNSIEPGEVLTFTFQGRVIGDPPSPITNTVTVIRETTISGVNTNERDEPDVSSTATLPLPSLAIRKTVSSPVGRAAAVGETVTFSIVVTNNGAMGLNPLALTDTFDNVYLAFTSAVPPVNASSSGLISWTNIGPLAVGGTTSLTVNFTALASTLSALTTNTVTVYATTTNGLPLPPETSSAPVEVATVGYTLTKVTTAPTNRAAQRGESVSFLVTIANTGEVTLVTVPVQDTYETNFLSYVGAIPVSTDLVNDGIINWTNVGPLAQGVSTTIVLNFTAANSSTGSFRTNVVVASPITPTNKPPVAPQTSSAPYAVSKAGYLLTKTRTAPTNRAAQIGEAVTFNVTIQNTGDVTLVTVPVTDTYETVYLTYGGATPASDDNVDDGLVTWTNIGPVPAGASTSLVLSFTAASSSTGSIRTNVVATAPTVPTNSPPLGPQTSSAPYAVSKSGYLLTKTLVSPTGRSAQVGEPIVFNVTIVNTGDTQLVTVPVTDSYETVYLTYTGSTPATVDNVNDGLINWVNVGPLPIGASTTLVVNFTAANSSTGQFRTNVVFTAPTVPTNEPPVGPQTSTVPYSISKSGYRLTKTIVSPIGRSAQIGEPVIFNVTIANTGDVQLVTVPVTDLYETVYLSYTGATPATVDNVDDGVINWTDVGPLSAGASTTLVVNFTAINSSTGQFRTNVVFTTPTVPTNTPPVGPQTSTVPYSVNKSGYLLTKTLVSPLGRSAQVGEAVIFNVTILNTGDVQLVTVPVTDAYETAYLTYTGATPATVDNVNDGLINWANVGPLPIGASTTLVVNFTAANSSTGQFRTNVVFTAPTVPTNTPPVGPQTSTVPYSVSKSGYLLTKTLVSPTGRAAQVGEAVTFNVTIQNTGDVQLVTVPAQDTYETNFLAFSGAVPATTDTVDDGVINWTNVGPLNVGASTTLVVNYTAVNSSTGQPRTNLVFTAPSVPTNTPPVPPQTSTVPYRISSAGYTLTKIRISPTNRPAHIGEAVVFNVTLVNTGDVQLVTVPLADTYETNYLTWSSAIPASDDNVNDGVINWTDVGPLNVGASTTLVLNFVATNTSGALDRTNRVVATPTVPTNEPPVLPKTNEAPYAVGKVGYLLTKTILAPTNRAAQIGESVTFNISIVNTGDQPLVTVPVTDTYETAYLTYTGAVPASDDNVNDGTLNWADIGPLGIGASTNIVVYYTAANSSTGALRTNTVVTAPTVPTNVPPVGPQTSTVPYSVNKSGYLLTKTLVSPLGRSAQVGEAVVFNVTVLNTGDVQLVTVPVTDTYETAYLTYTGSTPATVDNVNDGLINWANVGPLPIGASTTLVVNFTAANSSTGQLRTNVVFTAPTVPTNTPPVGPQTSTVPYSVSKSGYLLTKTLVSPTGRAAQVGEAVTFNVTIQNTGDVQLVTVPAQDTYETNFLAFSGAVPATTDTVDDGVINWTNVGPLNVGASTTLVVNYTAVNSSTGQPRTNLVFTAPSVPTNTPPVPPQTSTVPYRISSAGYTLAKVRISPTNRPALIGEAVVFNVTVVNTGDVQLVTVPLADTYETNYLTWSNAVPASDDNVNDGAINWANVGPLSVGASTTLVLNFVATNTSGGLDRTNRVVATPTVPTNEPPVLPKTNEAPYAIGRVGYLLTKTIVAPTGRAAQIGESVTFNISIVNTGDQPLVTVPVTDTYETAYLTYTGAVPASADNVNDGTINWPDVGPVGIGASTNIVVYYTAANSSTGALRTNTVVTTPTVPTNVPPVPPQTSTVPYSVVKAGYLLTKTLVSPTGRAAQVGEPITFNVTIQNTGDVQLVTVPAQDTYETNFIAFNSAIPATTDAVNDGVINWTNVGPVNVGASTTLVLHFTAMNSSTSQLRTNLVFTAPLTPTNTPPVAPQTSTVPYSISDSGYILTKTLVSPTGRAAQVGEAVVFNISIVNNGDVGLVTVPVTDTYETAYLTYTGSTPATVDNVNDGLITWANVGPLPIGASTTLVVNFTAINSSTSQPRTNLVFTAPTVPTNQPPVSPQTSNAPYEISKAGYLLTKTLVSPTGRAAQVGESIVFNVTIQNTGDVTLVTVPAQDTYETNYIAFNAALPATTDAVNDGVINWTNVGPVGAGASTTLVLNFTAVNSSTSQFRTNLVFTAPTVPTNEPPVPPQTSTVPYNISKSGYLLTKTLVSPTGRSAQVGEAVVFNVTVLNTGDVQLVTVPVTDTYETVYLTYAGSTPATVDNVNDGLITWLNVGPLNVGASTTLVVNFTAINSSTGQPRTNIVFSAPTVPTNEPPVPPETSTVPYRVSKSGYVLSKTRIAPTNRAAQVGEAVTFNVTIVNTGDVQLVTVPVTDTYETVYLTYTGATPTSVDNVNDGVINWTNVGPLPAGASTTLVVQFTAASSSTNQSRTNVVFTTPTVPTNEPPVGPQTSTAPYEVSRAGYSLVKTIVAPTGRAAQVGEAVVFNVTIVNTGDVQLVTVPVTDTYETTYLTYTGSVPATVDNVNDGLINWLNVGPLNVGASMTLVVNFTAINSSAGSFRTNLVTTAPTVPTNTPPVPPQTSTVPYSVSKSGYVLSKTRIAPTNRAAQVGEAVTFNVTIVNTGDVQLVTVPVTDTYETVYLTYTGSTPTSVDNINDGVINWTNVGPLPAGASTTLVVQFTAASSSTNQSRTNVVFTTPTVPTNEPPVGPQTSTAPYEVSHAGYSLVKTIVAPTGRAAQVGEAVVFNVTIVNTGDVQLVTVPVTDTYETAYLAYTGATPATVDNVDDGLINWLNVGPLNVGASTTLVVNFTAINSSTGSFRTNLVTTAPTVPTNTPPVPPTTSTVPYAVSHAGYLLQKTLLAPTNRPPIIGETLTFQITVINTGDVQLVTVPLIDTYDTAYIAIQSGVVAPDDLVNDGTLNWSNVGSVAVGNSTSVVVTFTAVGSTTNLPQTNKVVALPTVPTNSPPVPPQTSTVPYVVDAPAKLGNFVWDDLNGNGVQDGGEPGVTGVTVTLYGPATNVLATTTTDGSGFYAFTNLVPATYLVGVTQPSGYSFTLQNVGSDTADSDADPATGLMIPTVLVSGETDLTWDAGLYRPASVGNFVWLDLNADGIQDGGEPGLSGFTVILHATNGTALATNVTDGSGFYSFTNLPPESYYVEFVQPGGYQHSPANQTVDTADSDAATNNGLTATFVLSSGQTDNSWDAGFYQFASLGDFVWVDLNGNGLQDPAEGGATNVTVNLYAGSTLVATTATDTNGLYLFTNLVPGNYFVEVLKPFGYAITLRDQGANDTVDSDIATNNGRTVTTTLTSGENDLTWDGGLFVPGTFAGTVYNDQNNDGTQQYSEVSFANVQVQLYLNTGTSSVLVASMPTDANGDYLFTGLLPGTYFADVVNATVPFGYVLGNHFVDPSTNCVLVSADHITDIDFGYLNSTTNALVGDFVWSDFNGDGIQDSGEPGIGNVRVSLLTAGPDTFFGTADDVTNAFTTTGPSGYYGFTNVLPGTYVVKVTSGTGTPLQGLSGVSGPQSYSNATTPFVVISNSVLLDKDFGYVGLTGRIGNQVWLDLDGDGLFDTNETGIAGVTVNLTDTNGIVIATQTTDGNGQYLFVGLAAGTYRVDVTDVGNVLAGLVHTTGTPNTDNNSQPDPVQVTLPAGGSILYADFGYAPPAGSIGNQVFSDLNQDGVFDSGDAGLPNVTVLLYDASGTNVIGTALTDANGKYLFSGLTGATYQVDVVDATVPAGMTVGPLGTAGLDNNSQAQLYTVVLPNGGANFTADFGYVMQAQLGISIGDTVYFDWNSNGVQDAHDSPIPGIRLDLYLDVNGNGVLDGPDILLGSDTTDTNGNYLFSGLAPTNYIVKLIDPLNLLGGTVETEGTIPEAVNATDAVDHLDVDFGFYPVTRQGTLGDTVWVDINMNGIPDENLSTEGIDHAIVNLYRVVNGVTNFYGTQTTATGGPGGQRGYYQFTGLPYGDYHVEVILTTVPSNLNIPTTTLSYDRNIGPPKSIQDADFGFITANPTAVELKYFHAAPVNGGIALTWGTAWEKNTLGYNLYRATTPGGERSLVNSGVIPGQGAESGYDYQFNDTAATEGQTYYYWLEEVENGGKLTDYGPVAARLGAAAQGVVGTFNVAPAQVYRISYETLLNAGVPASQIDPATYHVQVDGVEVAALVMAYGDSMKSGDFILFYAPAGADERHVSIAVSDDPALRMDWVYAEPADGAGDTFLGAAQDGKLAFDTSPSYVRYMLTNFQVPPTWIFDVTDSYRPKFLFGAADLSVSSGLGVYLSYFTEQPAHCLAIDDSVVVDITKLDAPGL